MPQLHDVSLTTDERQFLLFRDAMHFALGSRPDLHRAGVVVRGDTGFRLLQVDGATRVLDVWDWLVEHAQLLTEGAPRAAALVIPTQVDGSLRPAPAGEGIDVYDVSVWAVDNRRRMDGSVVRCRLEDGVLTRLPWQTARPGAGLAVASLLGTLLAEFSDPPPAPMRLVAPLRSLRSVPPVLQAADELRAAA